MLQQKCKYKNYDLFKTSFLIKIATDFNAMKEKGFDEKKWDSNTLLAYKEKINFSQDEATVNVEEAIEVAVCQSQDLTGIKAQIDDQFRNITWAAGLATTVKIPFPKDALYARNKIEFIQDIVKYISEKLLLTEHIAHFLLLEIGVEIADSRDASINTHERLYKFPKKGTFPIQKEFEIKKMGEALKALFETIHEQPLDNTSQRIVGYKSLTIKILRRPSGGCVDKSKCDPPKGNIVTKKTLMQVGGIGKDNLCFWRCLAIGKYESTNKNITKQNSTFQKEKAIELRNEYYKSCNRKSIPEGTDGDNDQVLLDRDTIRDISSKLGLNIVVYMLVEKLGTALPNAIEEPSENPRTYTVRELVAESFVVDENKPINLHYQNEHYMLIRSMSSYGNVLFCRYCRKKVWTIKNSRRHQKHEEKCEKKGGIKESKLKFTGEPVRHLRTVVEGLLDEGVQRPIIAGFDFECALLPVHDDTNSSATELISTHTAVGYVLKFDTVQFSTSKSHVHGRNVFICY